MGRQVAFAYRPRKPSFSPSPLSSPATSPPHMDPLPPSPVNYTPARKHHKLLKDGSEVWSKDVERVFVEGLRLYWGSPWATYSRGRSRWRNQYLVDHLKKHGIERTKKQVASHIQVLRNMWRGEPEFHLVGGGEDLFKENGLLASKPKSNTNSPKSTSSKSDLRAGSSPASSTSSSLTPEYPTSELSTEAPPPSVSLPSLSPPPQLPPFSELEDMFSGHGPQTDVIDPTDCARLSPPRTTHAITSSSVKLEPLAMDPALFTLPTPPFVEPSVDYAMCLPNRISNLFFWADGMASLSVDLDRLIGGSPSCPPRSFLHFRVSLPPVADLRCPPDFQGINGAASFASGWSSIAKCHTKSWAAAGRTVLSQDLGLFTQVTTPGLQTCLNADVASSQMVYAYLPESALSRCHWLDAVGTITQQLIVDNEVLAVLVYHIERVADPTHTVPAMELLGFQKHPWRGTAPPPAATAAASSSSSSAASSLQTLLASPSPPHSPHSPSFLAAARRYTSAPVSPQSPLFSRTGVLAPGASAGGSNSTIGSVAGDMTQAQTNGMYAFPPPLPSYAYPHPSR